MKTRCHLTLGRFRYSESQQKKNIVLVHQEAELSKIQFPSARSIDATITSSEEMLQRLGYDLSGVAAATITQNTPTAIEIPSWQELSRPSRMLVQDCKLKICLHPKRLGETRM